MAAGRGRQAAPVASKVLQQMRGQLERGWPPGLTVLTGDDLYHLDRAQRSLLAALAGSEPSEFGLTVFGEQKTDVAEIVGAARSLGMFSSRRVVLARDLDALEGEPDSLIAYAENPPAGSYLLVRAPALDRRRKLHKALESSGHLLAFKTSQDPRQLVREIERLADEKGVKLDSGVARLMAQLHGGDLYRVDVELEKLHHWLGQEARPATRDDLREVTAFRGALSGFDLADAVAERDAPRALKTARGLLDAGDEILMLIGALAYRSRLMIQARALVAAGRSPQQAVATLGAWHGGKVMETAVKRYDLEETLGFPERLLRVDRTIKSRSIDRRGVLEQLVRELTGGRRSP